MAVTVTKAKIGVVVLGLLGLLLLVIGVVALSLLPTLFKAKIQENLVLEEGKEAYEKWKTTPIPVTFKVYIFNITNPKEVMEGLKPSVQDIGPYVFKQYRSKDVLSWNKEAMTVTYNDLKRYQFVPELSANMSNRIYSLNLPLQGILMFLKKLPDFSRSLVVPLLEGVLRNYNESLFSYRTAQELLFDGYKVDLIQDLIDLASAFVTVPEILPNNTFGFLYGKNNSGDGIFEVFTGEDDISKYSQIVKWNNMSRIPFWNNQYCNMMNGTDGSQFPPPISKKDVLYVYTPELCRSVSLEFAKETNVRGIPALRFATPDRLFASPLVNPDNMCYCTDEKYCSLSGILDVSPCRKGMKLAVTGPHFFLAHEFIQERVTGLNASREAHETYVDIEPNTGFVLRASRKLQMNFILDKFEEMEETKSVMMSVIPLIWVVEEAEIDEKVATMFTAKVRTPIVIAKSVLTASIVLGILWIIIAALVTVYILVKVRKFTQQKAAKAVIKSKYKVVPQKPEDIIKSEKTSSVNA
ncbi:lysosome membrane protein 2 [Trichonephila inaurata madagascariensis]|uniref:Lysosome membrane protein 2 n=1 Tax=Trichonephila inaurata madagascariensis TaxID=2747483 RepID=A0A8X7C7J6_9ARAC|nr:lysosome membrane protein 2 [Trichonephila inaurata madagascariensis]